MLETILNSKVRCVGSCVQKEDGGLALDLRGKSYSEVWGCFSQTVGAQPYFVVISKDGKTLEHNSAPCHAGMPVFAPPIEGSLNELLRRHGIAAEELKGLKRPYAWPVNSWE